MEPGKPIETLWPVGLADIPRHELQELDDLTFGELRRRFYERQLRRGASRKRAKEVARELTKRRDPRQIFPIPKRMLLARRRNSELLQSLVPVPRQPMAATY